MKIGARMVLLLDRIVGQAAPDASASLDLGDTEFESGPATRRGPPDQRLRVPATNHRDGCRIAIVQVGVDGIASIGFNQPGGDGLVGALYPRLGRGTVVVSVEHEL